MTQVLGLYVGVVFERQGDVWLPLSRDFLSIQLVKISDEREKIYRIWVYQDENLKIEMRVLSSLKASRKETFVKLLDDQFEESVAFRFKTKAMSTQFFDDIRDAIRKAPSKEIVDMNDDSGLKQDQNNKLVTIKVHLPGSEKERGRKCRIRVDKRTTMGQLLAAIRKSPKINNPDAWIELRPSRYNPLPPHFTVSSSIGKLKVKEIWVVDSRGPPIPPPIKITCYLPVGNRVVMETNPHITIKEMFIYLCDKYKLDKTMHNVVSKRNKTKALEMDQSVVGSQVETFSIIRRQQPVSESEFWDTDLDCKACDDCEIDILPYTSEWNATQKHDLSHPPPQTSEPPGLDLPRRWQDEAHYQPKEEQQPADNKTGTLDRIKRHLSQWYGGGGSTNLGPLQGGTVPTKFGKFREGWRPPFRDTIQDINFEKNNDMYGLDHVFSPPPYLKDSNKHDMSSAKDKQHNMSGDNTNNNQNNMQNQNYVGSHYQHGYQNFNTSQSFHPFQPPRYPYMPYYPSWPYYPLPLPFPYPIAQNPPDNPTQKAKQPEKVEAHQNEHKPTHHDFSGQSNVAVSDSSEQTEKQNFKDYPAPKPPDKRSKVERVTDHHRLVMADDEVWSKKEEDEATKHIVNPETSLIDGKDNNKDIPTGETSRREPFKKTKAPPPPNISTRTVRKFHGPPIHPADYSSKQEKLQKSDLGTKMKSYMKRMEKKKKKGNDPVPQESAELHPKLVESQPLSPLERKLKRAGILKDNRKNKLVDKAFYKESSEVMKEKGEELIDGLVGTMNSGNILKTLPNVDNRKHKLFGDADHLVQHGFYLRQEH